MEKTAEAFYRKWYYETQGIEIKELTSLDIDHIKAMEEYAASSGREQTPALDLQTCLDFAEFMWVNIKNPNRTNGYYINQVGERLTVYDFWVRFQPSVKKKAQREQTPAAGEGTLFTITWVNMRGLTISETIRASGLAEAISIWEKPFEIVPQIICIKSPREDKESPAPETAEKVTECCKASCFYYAEKDEIICSSCFQENPVMVSAPQPAVKEDGREWKELSDKEISNRAHQYEKDFPHSGPYISWRRGYANGQRETAAALQASNESLKREVERLQKLGHLVCDDADDAENKVAELEREVEKLKEWKESAMKVMPDFQKIGKLLGIGLGEDVSSQIIPRIKELQKEIESLEGWKDWAYKGKSKVADLEKQLQEAKDKETKRLTLLLAIYQLNVLPEKIQYELEIVLNPQ